MPCPQEAFVSDAARNVRVSVITSLGNYWKTLMDIYNVFSLGN